MNPVLPAVILSAMLAPMALAADHREARMLIMKDDGVFERCANGDLIRIGGASAGCPDAVQTYSKAATPGPKLSLGTSAMANAVNPAKSLGNAGHAAAVNAVGPPLGSPGHAAAVNNAPPMNQMSDPPRANTGNGPSASTGNGPRASVGT